MSSQHGMPKKLIIPDASLMNPLIKVEVSPIITMSSIAKIYGYKTNKWKQVRQIKWAQSLVGVVKIFF